MYNLSAAEKRKKNQCADVNSDSTFWNKRLLRLTFTHSGYALFNKTVSNPCENRALSYPKQAVHILEYEEE
jgi:hypothetical protein